MSPRKLTLDKDRVLAAPACSWCGGRPGRFVGARGCRSTGSLGWRPSTVPMPRWMNSAKPCWMRPCSSSTSTSPVPTPTFLPQRRRGAGHVRTRRTTPVPRPVHRPTERGRDGDSHARLSAPDRGSVAQASPPEPAVRDELIMDLWIYTHGLASMVIANLLPGPSPMWWTANWNEWAPS